MVHPCIQSSITECRPGTGLIAGHGGMGWMRPLHSGKLLLVGKTKRAREYSNLWLGDGQAPGRPQGEQRGSAGKAAGWAAGKHQGAGPRLGAVWTSRASLTFKVRMDRQEVTGQGKRHHC